jgi:uncharacterized Tic20 family protein
LSIPPRTGCTQEQHDMPTSPDLDRELDAMADDMLRAETRGDAATAASPSSGHSGPGVRVARALPPSRSMVPPSSPAGTPRVSDETFPHSDRNLAMLVHLGSMCTTLFSGGLFLPVLVPLLAKLVFKDNSAGLQEHIRQQLNFQLTLAIVAVVGVAGTVLTFGVGLFAFLPLILFMLGVEVFASVKGAIAASNGEQYAFPFTMDLVKDDPTVRALPR